MERKSVVAIVMVLGLAAGAAAQDKKEAEAGPYNLPTLAQVKDRVKPSEDEAKKLEEIYVQAVKNEAESKARARENGTDRKTLEGYMTLSRNETINKVKALLDKDKAQLFDKLCAAQPPPGKKKK